MPCKVDNRRALNAQTADSFAVQEWKLTPLTIATAPVYLPWSLLFMAGFLSWMCLETFGPARHRVCSWTLILSGIWLGAGVAWRY